MREHVTFYGHFSGWWSYAAVCREIASVLNVNIDLSIIDLSRIDQVPEEQRLYGVDGLYIAEARAQKVRERLDALEVGQDPGPVQALPGAALVFTNPNNLPAIPQHARMAVYAVCDADRAPDSWVEQLNDRADVVLTPSAWSAQALVRSGVYRPIRVVRHGVNPHVFCPGDGSTPRERIRFFCTSETGSRKGLWEFCYALDQLAVYRPDIIKQVTIHTPFAKLVAEVGQWPWADEIEFEDEPIGAPMDVAKVLRRTRLLVAPSRAEGFGLLPLEAACCGCPVVVSEATGHLEFTKHVAFQEAPHVYLLEAGPKELLDRKLDQAAKAPTIDATRLAEVMLLALSGARQRTVQRATYTIDDALVIGRVFFWARVLTADSLIPTLLSE